MGNQNSGGSPVGSVAPYRLAPFAIASGFSWTHAVSPEPGQVHDSWRAHAPPHRKRERSGVDPRGVVTALVPIALRVAISRKATRAAKASILVPAGHARHAVVAPRLQVPAGAIEITAGVPDQREERVLDVVGDVQVVDRGLHALQQILALGQGRTLRH